MTQKEIIDLLAEWVGQNIPPSWLGRVLEPTALYSYVFYKLNAPEKSAILVKPYRIEWVRRDRQEARRVHLIDILIFGGSKKTGNVTAIMDGIEDLGNRLMLMPFEDVAVYGVETLSDGPAGYDPDALEETDTPFLGGIRINVTV